MERNQPAMKKRKRNAVIISILAASLVFCCLIYAGVQKAKRITVDDSVRLLLEYIYDMDYFPLCTRYESEEDEPLMTVYNAEWVRYPVYEFEIPNDTLPIRRQIACIGETRDGEWLFFGVCLWKYYTEGEERVYMMPIYDSRYAVNRLTKEIVQERYKSDGWWIYNGDYEQIAKKPLVHKNFSDRLGPQAAKKAGVVRYNSKPRYVGNANKYLGDMGCKLIEPE